MGMTTRRAMLVLAGVFLACGAVPAIAQLTPEQEEPETPADSGEKRGGADLGLRQAVGEIEVTDQVVAASKIAPANPAALRKIFPETLAGMQRQSVSGGVQWLGPAGVLRMRMAYGNEAGTRSLTVEIIDRAGFQHTVGGEMEIPPIGSTRREGAQIVEGLEISGYPALARHVRPGLTAIVHLALNTRMRLTFTSNLPIKDLVGAVASLDLPAIAALAPTAQ